MATNGASISLAGFFPSTFSIEPLKIHVKIICLHQNPKDTLQEAEVYYIYFVLFKVVGVVVTEESLESMLLTLPACNTNVTSCTLLDDAAYVIASNNNGSTVSRRIGCLTQRLQFTSDLFRFRLVTRSNAVTQAPCRCSCRAGSSRAASMSTFRRFANRRTTATVSRRASFHRSSSRCSRCAGGVRSSFGCMPTSTSHSGWPASRTRHPQVRTSHS